METNYGLFDKKCCGVDSHDEDCQQPVFGFNDYSKKIDLDQKVNTKKCNKRNILEEISSLEDSINKEIEGYSSDVSDDERNYHTLKNMLVDMKEMLTTCSRNQPPTTIPEDYENSNFSIFMQNKVYDDLNDDDFSMKGFKTMYNGLGNSDMYDKNLGQCYDNPQFF